MHSTNDKIHDFQENKNSAKARHKNSQIQQHGLQRQRQQTPIQQLQQLRSRPTGFDDQTTDLESTVDGTCSNSSSQWVTNEDNIIEAEDTTGMPRPKQPQSFQIQSDVRHSPTHWMNYPYVNGVDGGIHGLEGNGISRVACLNNDIHEKYESPMRTELRTPVDEMNDFNTDADTIDIFDDDYESDDYYDHDNTCDANEIEADGDMNFSHVGRCDNSPYKEDVFQSNDSFPRHGRRRHFRREPLRQRGHKFSWFASLRYFLFGTSEATQKTLLVFLLIVGLLCMFLGRNDISKQYHSMKKHNEQVLDTMVVKASNDKKKSLVYQAFHDALKNGYSNPNSAIAPAVSLDGSACNISGDSTESPDTGDVPIEQFEPTNCDGVDSNSTDETVLVSSASVPPKLIEIHDNYETFHKLFFPISSGLCKYVLGPKPTPSAITTITTDASTDVNENYTRTSTTNNFDDNPSGSNSSELNNSENNEDLTDNITDGGTRARVLGEIEQLHSTVLTEKVEEQRINTANTDTNSFTPEGEIDAMYRESSLRQIDDRIKGYETDDIGDYEFVDSSSPGTYDPTSFSTNGGGNDVEDVVSEITSSEIDSTGLEQKEQPSSFVFDISIDCTKLYHLSPIRGTGNWLSFYYSMRLVLLSQRHSSMLFTCTDFSFAKDIPKDMVMPWLTGWFPSTMVIESSPLAQISQPITTTITNNSTVTGDQPGRNTTNTTIVDVNSSSTNHITGTINGYNDDKATTSILQTSSSLLSESFVLPTVEDVCMAPRDKDGNIIDDDTSINNYFNMDLTPIVPLVKQDLRRMALGLVGIHPDPKHPSAWYAKNHFFITDTGGSSGTATSTSNTNSSNSNTSVDDNTGASRDGEAMVTIIDPTQSIYSVPSSFDSPLLSKVELDDIVVHFPCIDLVGNANSRSSTSERLGEDLQGFFKFSLLTKYMSPSAQSIGIITQSIGDESDGDGLGDRCRSIVLAFVDYITDHYTNLSSPSEIHSYDSRGSEDDSSSDPYDKEDELTNYSNQSLVGEEVDDITKENNPTQAPTLPRIRVHNGNTETLAIARMVMANQTITSLSTFSIIASIASFGTAYIPQSNKIKWLIQKQKQLQQLHNPDPNTAIHTTDTSIGTNDRFENDTDANEEENYEKVDKGLNNFGGLLRRERIFRRNLHQHLLEEYYKRNEQDNNATEGEGQSLYHDGKVEIIEGGYPFFIKMEDVQWIWSEPDGEEKLLKWFRNETYDLP